MGSKRIVVHLKKKVPVGFMGGAPYIKCLSSVSGGMGQLDWGTESGRTKVDGRDRKGSGSHVL